MEKLLEGKHFRIIDDEDLGIEDKKTKKRLFYSKKEAKLYGDISLILSVNAYNTYKVAEFQNCLEFIVKATEDRRNQHGKE